jgi:hypothetical protein
VWGWEVALELGLEWPPDIDALAILPGRGYAISLSASVASTNPHLAPAIDGRDVLLIPEVFAFDSGRRLWRGDELETITNVLGYQLGNCGSIEIDPRGNPARPNPNLPGTTRPDLLFTRDVDTPFSHVFSTRSAGSKDGVLVRHRATYGYGTAKAVPDALAVLPGVSPPPTMDARATLRGPAPSFRNEITLIARTLGPRSTGWWILGLDRLVPGLDLHPDVTHNPLMVAPIVALPLVADEHGTARFELSVPQLGTPAVFYLQAFSDDRRALSPPAILTLQ